MSIEVPNAARAPLKVGIAGFGTIGRKVAAALDRGIAGLELSAVCARDQAKAGHAMAVLTRPVPLVDAAGLASACDVIVECVPRAAFIAIAQPALEAGRVLVTVSGAGLLAHPEVVELAKRHGGRIILATGALLGLDAVRAAAEGTIRSITMVTRKPPLSLKGAPYLVEMGIDVERVNAPTKVFDGSARDGAKGFPANVNVAAALGLAGIGPDQTRLEIWADPTVDRNTHSIEVESDEARFRMTIENVPSVENPATGKITALSVIACLRGLVGPLKVGT
ncbi:MAG: aspartate dehydrogenase [Alphaproteobacteria bacterium]|nr:aspartate dehydrogenase [Alphaproteobacteria bacterium]